MEIYPENRFWKTYFGKRISENGFRKTSFEKRVQKCAQVRRGEFYENGSKLHPYRGVTRTDAAFFISRILGCSYDYAEAFDYYISKYGHYNHIEQIFESYKETFHGGYHKTDERLAGRAFGLWRHSSCGYATKQT